MLDKNCEMDKVVDERTPKNKGVGSSLSKLVNYNLSQRKASQKKHLEFLKTTWTASNVDIFLVRAKQIAQEDVKKLETELNIQRR